MKRLVIQSTVLILLWACSQTYGRGQSRGFVVCKVFNLHIWYAEKHNANYSQQRPDDLKLWFNTHSHKKLQTRAEGGPPLLCPRS